MQLDIMTINETTQVTQSTINFRLTPEINSIVIGLFLVIIAIVVLWKLKQFIINSALGVIALFLLQFVGISIPINPITVIISAVLGLAGVGLMVLLAVLGFTF